MWHESNDVVALDRVLQGVLELEVCDKHCMYYVHFSYSLLSFRGGATDLKVGGTKQDSRAERAENFFCNPHFSKCVGYKQANISRGLLNILKFAVWFLH